MSRAFVREQDDGTPEVLPDIVVPPPPNPVTAHGLAAIEAEIGALEARLHEPADDPAETAALRRKLRYWTARRTTAHVTAPPTDPAEIGFGSVITLNWPGRGRLTMQVVGEDEADPATGRVSWRAPTVAALIGSGPGDRVPVRIGDKEITLAILAVDNAVGRS